MKSYCLNNTPFIVQKNLLWLVFFLAFAGLAHAQDVEDLLYIEVDNIDPVYKPFVGLGVGTFSYFGDVRNANQNPFNPSLGYKVNLTTYLDNQRFYRGNFYLIGGAITGNERSYDNPMRNMNFKTQLFIFGINVNYDFDHFYKNYNRLHPFVSLGFETMTYQSKVDSFGTYQGEKYQYHYWDDGTIRIGPQNVFETNANVPKIKRDYQYETNLRDYDWGQGAYPQYAFAIPVEVGLDYQVSDRVLFRFGLSYHFNLSDNIDHVSSKNTSGVIGNKRNDDFMYSYFSLHLDLFSEDKTLNYSKLVEEIDYDFSVFYADEDNDGIYDGFDDCPGTPAGVQVDSNGCPLDDDFDGVPNYADAEPNTPIGTYVNDDGVGITDDELAEMISFTNAVRRVDVPLYIRKPESYANYKRTSLVEIPEKFKKVDSDSDNYISYDEMMDAINKFFDFDSELSSDDIYELNNLFFAQ